MHIHTHVLPEKMRPSHALSLEAFVAAQRLLEPALAGPSFLLVAARLRAGFGHFPYSISMYKRWKRVCVHR